jgi:hypothetical protein
MSGEPIVETAGVAGGVLAPIADENPSHHDPF